MLVCLVNPPSPFLMDSGVHGPLGLWYIGAALKVAGHGVIYADLGLGDAIPTDADVYGVTTTTPQLAEANKAIHHIIETMGKGVILGGPHATAAPQHTLDHSEAHIVVSGEGEAIMLDAIAHIQHGDLYVNLRAPRIHHLDSVPLPDRTQARRYHYTIADRHGRAYEATTMVTSRGCPHACSFCSHAVWQQLVRFHSAGRVIAEMRGLKEQWGYNAVHIFDDSLAINKRRLADICAGIEPLGMTWRCFVRADQVTPELLAMMAAAGCVEIGLGVESGSQTVLDAIHKGETVAQQAQAIAWAKQAGIRVKAFMIVGLPAEDWKSIDETALFLDRTQPDDVDFTVLQIYPGSPIYMDPMAFGIELTSGPSWYKGKRGEYGCSHRTTALSSDDILVARDYLAARYGKR